MIRDTREQPGHGWYFEPGPFLAGTVTRTLQTADYSLEGFENELAIERKSNTGEIARNILEGRFRRELERLEYIKHPFVVCEFTWEDVKRFPEGSGIPRDKWPKLRVSANFMLACLLTIQTKYRTKLFMAGRNAQDWLVPSLFKRVVEACRLSEKRS